MTRPLIRRIRAAGFRRVGWELEAADPEVGYITGQVFHVACDALPQPCAELVNWTDDPLWCETWQCPACEAVVTVILSPDRQAIVLAGHGSDGLADAARWYGEAGE